MAIKIPLKDKAAPTVIGTIMSYFASRAFAFRVVRFFIALAIVLALVTGFFAWRLAQGPLSLNFAVPFVANMALDRVDGAEVAEIGDVQLAWNRQTEHLGMRIESLTLRNAQNEKIVSADHIDASVAALPLLWGSMRFRHVNIVQPYALLYVSKNGDFGFAADMAAQPAPGNKDHKDFNQWLNSRRGSWWWFFKSFQLNDAQLILVDQDSSRRLNIVVPNVSIKRNRKGLNANAQVFISQDGGEDRASTSMQLSAGYDAGQHQTKGGFNFQNMRVDDLSLLAAPFLRQLGFNFAEVQRPETPAQWRA